MTMLLCTMSALLRHGLPRLEQKNLKMNRNTDQTVSMDFSPECYKVDYFYFCEHKNTKNAWNMME